MQVETDVAVLRLLGKRIAAARLRKNWTQAQFAEQSGVSKRTLERLEAGESVQLINWIRVLRTADLLDNLKALIPEPVDSPLDLLKLKKKRRRRASGTAKPKDENQQDSLLDETESNWQWDD